jgi:hypothetical protein
MANPKQKQITEIPKPRTRFIDLDPEDRKFLLPRIQKAVEGKKAEQEAEQYVASILRRSGVPGTKSVIDRACTKILVTPETKQ